MAGVYISYPFCPQKCTYCNFASGVFGLDLEQRYLRALQTELERCRWPCRPETVYLGGGTPSRISEPELQALLEAVPGPPWEEATLEAAPGTVTADAARAWRLAGINRVSLGVQSFVRAEIARTGRRHAAETVAEEVGRLRAAGIDNFNIDLIVGLPGQTHESWDQSLECVARLEAPHVSVYMLEIDGDSRLGREALSGGIRYGAGELPDDELVVELYEAAVERLDRLGIRRYEISNFARPSFESRHNLKYWRLEPYLGFGADAHSCEGGLRWWNVETPAQYVTRITQGESARSAAEPARPEEERFFVGLRLREGVRPSQEERQRFEAPIRRLLRDGLLEAEGEVLRLSERAVVLANEVLQEFVAA